MIEDVDKEKFTVKIQNMSSEESPIIITQSEFMRRMKYNNSYQVQRNFKCLVLCQKIII